MSQRAIQYAESFKKGKERFDSFCRMAEDCGYTVTPASKFEDINLHFDCTLTNSSGETLRVDVKGRKKLQRSHTEFDDSNIWVELVNVQGNIGWLYAGAEAFAFELEHIWMFVSAEELRDMVNTRLIKENVDTPQPYKLYERDRLKSKRQNKEHIGPTSVITIVPLKDMEEIKMGHISKLKHEKVA